MPKLLIISHNIADFRDYQIFPIFNYAEKRKNTEKQSGGEVKFLGLDYQ